MTIQDCIKLITEHKDWSYDGSFVQVHPVAPASIGGGGGLRERRYKFTVDGQQIHFNTKAVRLKGRVIARKSGLIDC